MIITIFIMIMFIFIGILFINNKGSWLISGYNTMSKEEKEKYNEKALYKFMAYLMFSISACLGLIALGGYLMIKWVIILAAVAMVITCIGSIAYCSVGDRFKK